MMAGLFKYYPQDSDKLNWFANCQTLLTPPKYFNDPWDFLVLSEQWTEAELREQCPSSRSYSPEVFKEFKEAVTGADFHAGERSDYQEQIGKIVGVVSLAENPIDRIMWANYGGSHHGFVAEFAHGLEFVKDGFCQRAGPFGPAAKIQYLKPHKQPPKCKRDASNIAQVLWTKHSEWVYEQELRVVQSHCKATPGKASDGTPRSLLKFEPKDLSRVIFGLRICSTVEAKLMQMLSRPEFRHVRKEAADIDPVTNKLILRGLH
jgi:hypothetical protein